MQTLRDRLRDAVREIHDRIDSGETVDLGIMASSPTLADYRRFLELQYGFIAPAEEALSRAEAAAPLLRELGGERLRKHKLIEQDLRILGVGPETIIPLIWNFIFLGRCFTSLQMLKQLRDDALADDRILRIGGNSLRVQNFRLVADERRVACPFKSLFLFR